MASPLELLSGPGKPLRQEPPDAKEFAGLQRSGLARLHDAGITHGDLTALLYLQGYRREQFVTG